MLLVAFAFAVMADPVSSVAYAIEAALRALGGNLGLLLPTMGLVIGIVALVTASYHQVVARFPQGGGAAAAVGEAFGDGWSFIPVAALVVDFALTIAISAAAATSAVIAYVPPLAPWRIPVAALVVAGVAAVSWFGHMGRLVFAVMTIAFVILGVVVLVYGLGAHPMPSVPETAKAPARSGLWAVAMAFPVAMALATGVEAPASAIAQLSQLDPEGRTRFGRITLWLTVAIVGTLTLGLTAQAVHLHIGIPVADGTQIADLARATVPAPVFGAFQIVTALLLLSAASSSFQAGPGLLEALSGGSGGTAVGILPAGLGRTNRHRTPHWGLLFFTLAATVLTVAAGGQDQRLVLFYAVAVFVSFFAGLLAMARLSLRERRFAAVAVNLIAVLAVGFTLLVNLARGAPVVSVLATLLIAAALHWLWVRSGRPSGVRDVARHPPRAAVFGSRRPG